MDDAEFKLTYGPWSVLTSSYGASLRGLWHEGREIVTSYSGKQNKVGGQGDVLIPFPGRVGGAAYHWEGEHHHLEANDKDGPNAIHGFVRNREWQISEQGDHFVAFEHSLQGAPGYPYYLGLRLAYEIGENGLKCSFLIRNVGDKVAPVAAGFHPYVSLGGESIDAYTLKMPFTKVLEMNNLIPTGRLECVQGTPLDFTAGRAVGATALNHCFANLDGDFRVSISNGEHGIELWADEAFPYIVLYSGDQLPDSHRRKGLAIEPMTCASDAFNNPDWGLKRLEPGESFSGSWGIKVPPASRR